MAKKDLSKLVAKQKLVTRKDGSVFTQTVWVDPNKEIKQPGYSKTYKNKATTTASKYTGTTRLDHSDFKRGEQVNYTDKAGNKLIAEFRHIVVDKKNPKGLAHLHIIDAEGKKKVIGRKVEQLSKIESSTTTGSNSTFVRRTTTEQFSLGDRVSFNARMYDISTGKVTTGEMHGYITRFVSKDERGELVHIKMDDGTTKGRYLHNIIRYDARLEQQLAPEKIVALNKAITKLVNRNDEDYNLAEIVKTKRNSEAQLVKLQMNIDERNMKMKAYLQVLRNELPFEDLHEFAEEVEPEKPKEPALTEQAKIEAAAQAQLAAEEHTKVIEEARVRGLLQAKKIAVTNSKANIKRLTGATDFRSKLELYRSLKGYSKNMDDLIQFMKENGIELDADSQEYLDNPPTVPIKPVKPVEEPTEPTVDEDKPKASAKTITTVSKEQKNRKKLENRQKEIDDINSLIAKTKGMGLKPETEEILLARYEQKIKKLGGATRTAKPKKNEHENIVRDMESVANGQDVGQFKLNQRISDLDVSDDVKRELRLKFAASVKAGIALKKNVVRSAKSELKNGNKPTDMDLTDLDDPFAKALELEQGVFNHFIQGKSTKVGEDIIMVQELFKALDKDDMFYDQFTFKYKPVKTKSGDTAMLVVLRRK